MRSIAVCNCGFHLFDRCTGMVRSTEFRDAGNTVRLQLHALAYNLANFTWTLGLPKSVEHWSLTSLPEQLVKIGAKVVHTRRYVNFQMAEVAVSRELFQHILPPIDGLRPRSAADIFSL
jgi:hypothetical protein